MLHATKGTFGWSADIGRHKQQQMYDYGRFRHRRRFVFVLKCRWPTNFFWNMIKWIGRRSLENAIATYLLLFFFRRVNNWKYFRPIFPITFGITTCPDRFLAIKKQFIVQTVVSAMFRFIGKLGQWEIFDETTLKFVRIFMIPVKNQLTKLIGYHRIGNSNFRNILLNLRTLLCIYICILTVENKLLSKTVVMLLRTKVRNIKNTMPFSTSIDWTFF